MKYLDLLYFVCCGGTFGFGSILFLFDFILSFQRVSISVFQHFDRIIGRIVSLLSHMMFVVVVVIVVVVVVCSFTYTIKMSRAHKLTLTHTMNQYISHTQKHPYP